MKIRFEDKTPEGQFQQFKNSAKDRKKRLAEKAGYEDIEEYRKYLEQRVTNDNSESIEEKSDIIVHDIDVIDISSSMRGSNIKAVNTYLKEREDKADAYSLITFSYEVKFIAKRAGKPQRKSLRVLGTTALNDAVYIAVDYAIKTRTKNEKTVIKVFTDGSENTSHLHNADDVQNIIKKAEDLGITVVFMGTKQEVSFAKDRYGVKDSNTMIHNNTSESVKKVVETLDNASVSYTTKAKAGLDVSEGFFKQVGTL